jgi:hypothetical protein
MQVHKIRLSEGFNTITGVERLVYMNYQDSKLYGWFTTSPQFQLHNYEVYVALTGEVVPDEYRYVTSTQHVSSGFYVLHAFD